MSGLALIILGVLVNCLGLYFFALGVMHHTLEAGAALAGLGDGLLGVVLINLGILLMIEGSRRRRG